MVAGAAQEGGEQLEVVVPVVVPDGDVDAELLARLRLVAELAAEPLRDACLRVVVPLEVGAPVHGEQTCEVVAVHKLLQVADGGEDATLDGIREPRAVRADAVFERDLGLHVGYPPVEYEVKGAALRLRLGGEVAYELAIRGKALAVAALQATLRREVRVAHDEALAHGVVADGLQQEALAGTVAAHDEAEARAAFGHKVKVMQQGRDLSLAPDRDVRKADAWDDAALE